MLNLMLNVPDQLSPGGTVFYNSNIDCETKDIKVDIKKTTPINKKDQANAFKFF